MAWNNEQPPRRDAAAAKPVKMRNRRAVALRENLRRRKAQARARAGQPPAAPGRGMDR